MSLGEQLRNARLAKNLTASEVAAATRMMVQIVEELEREDFHRFAAPIYGKGFIRLYAEHVGLDPRPLIEEYLDKFGQVKQPSLKSEDSSLPPDELPAVEPAAADAVSEDVFEKPESEKPGSPATRPAEFAPLVPPPGEEPDLFSRLEARITGAAARDAGPRPEPEPELPPVQSSSALRDEAPPAVPDREPERPFWDEEAGMLQDKIGRLRDAQRWRKPVVGGATFDLSNSPLRLLFVLGGVLLVLVLMIAFLNRCSVGGGSPARAARDDRPTELRLVEDPPEPSFGAE